MLIIGLTGSIGMGKSTAAKRFMEHGIAVFDADAAVHQLYEGKAAELIENAFPGTTADGVVDRPKLAAALKGDKAQIKKLEAIVHPLVRKAREFFLDEQSKSGADMAVLEIPLLLETGSQDDVDVTIVVSAPMEVQRARVLARPGMTEAKFDALLANQMPDAEKRRRADYVVDTSGEIEHTRHEIDRLVAMLRDRQKANSDDA